MPKHQTLTFITPLLCLQVPRFRTLPNVCASTSPLPLVLSVCEHFLLMGRPYLQFSLGDFMNLLKLYVKPSAYLHLSSYSQKGQNPKKGRALTQTWALAFAFFFLPFSLFQSQKRNSFLAFTQFQQKAIHYFPRKTSSHHWSSASIAPHIRACQYSHTYFPKEYLRNTTSPGTETKTLNHIHLDKRI